MKYADASQGKWDNEPKDEVMGDERVATMEESTDATNADRRGPIMRSHMSRVERSSGAV